MDDMEDNFDNDDLFKIITALMFMHNLDEVFLTVEQLTKMQENARGKSLYIIGSPTGLSIKIEQAGNVKHPFSKTPALN